MQPPHRDRRRYPRAKKILPVRLLVADSAFRAATVDLGPRGAFINTAIYPPVGTIVRVQREVAGERSGAEGPLPSVVAHARVVRTVTTHSRISEVPGIGLSWLKFEAATLGPLRRFLFEVLEARPEDIDSESLRRTGQGLVYYVERPRVYGVMSTLTPDDDGPSVLPVFAPREPGAARPRGGAAADATRLRSINTEATYFVEGLPHASRVLAVGATALYIGCEHAPPAPGQGVVLRTHLTGRFASYWVRFEGRVVRQWTPPGRLPRGFALEVDRVDELGQEGIFRRYLRYLDQLAKGGADRAIG